MKAVVDQLLLLQKQQQPPLQPLPRTVLVRADDVEKRDLLHQKALRRKWRLGQPQPLHFTADVSVDTEKRIQEIAAKKGWQSILPSEEAEKLTDETAECVVD